MLEMACGMASTTTESACHDRRSNVPLARDTVSGTLRHRNKDEAFRSTQVNPFTERVVRNRGLSGVERIIGVETLQMNPGALSSSSLSGFVCLTRRTGANICCERIEGGVRILCASIPECTHTDLATVERWEHVLALAFLQAGVLSSPSSP
jgi:hypothetical protein